jgi:hypothetical protein
MSESNTTMTGNILPVSDFLKIPPWPRRGKRPIMLDETVVKNRSGDELGPMLWRGKQWAVTEHGIEALDGGYYIEAARLVEKLPMHSWAEQVCGKTWCDTEEFVTAWLVALVLLRDAIPEKERPRLDPKVIRAAIERSYPGRDTAVVSEALP